MEKKGLTISFVIEAESANYGEGVGNVTALKKMTRGTGDSYTYISRQALRYNIIQQMGEDRTPLELDKSVIQFAPDAYISDYPEIDLFGYMKTNKGTKTRAAVVRLSNAIALESFQADTDFLTNKGLYDRYVKANKSEDQEDKKGGNIAQSEIHHSYYTYTIAIDLDQVGIDHNEKEIVISNEEKARRVQSLLQTLKFLYRDIKGRRENLSPLFAIGGVYDIKNPFFENRIKIKQNKINVNALKDVLALDKHIADHTKCGLIEGIFSNDEEIIRELNAISIGEFFDAIEKEVYNYYVG
ncbi:type I-B CRISPR-associated protein Cas7/Cst2/DevR [Calidifontibacillus erzurumensis]|uniref:type I-B CRISPR-associated protein Cas7/Cst2/DevR n=1 Tax=Calidifontibacillus erzurumensis TaxID=2741433 RepID=UPI0035B55A7D